ncbi:MAG: VWA domain-containing protein [Gemmatimonadaceae bacterium]
MPYRHSSRRRLRDLALLALRVLALALLIAAFARPVIARARASVAGTSGGRERVILVDRSFSMRYGDRWTKARAAVSQAIDQTGPRDRVTIVPFDLTAKAVLEPTADKAQLRAAFDSVTTVDGGTRLAPALTVARRILSGSTLPQREALVVSDFQRSSFDLTEDEASRGCHPYADRRRRW